MGEGRTGGASDIGARDKQRGLYVEPKIWKYIGDSEAPLQYIYRKKSHHYTWHSEHIDAVQYLLYQFQCTREHQCQPHTCLGRTARISRRWERMWSCLCIRRRTTTWAQTHNPRRHSARHCDSNHHSRHNSPCNTQNLRPSVQTSWGHQNLRPSVQTSWGHHCPTRPNNWVYIDMRIFFILQKRRKSLSKKIIGREYTLSLQNSAIIWCSANIDLSKNIFQCFSAGNLVIDKETESPFCSCRKT